jgi:hypothetical protein
MEWAGGLIQQETEALAQGRILTSRAFQAQIVGEMIPRYQQDQSVNLSNCILTLGWFELWKGNG